MGLVMVCPQCQAKVLLHCQSCPYCQSDLRDVPQDQRRYALGQPGPSTPPSAPESVSEAIPVLESASVPEISPQPVPSPEFKVRRPHVRRYAAPPVAASHPVTAQSGKGAESKPEAKKSKKPRAAASKKKK
jgi:hypothetical protein